MGKTAAAIGILNRQIEQDPLNHLARFEKYMNTRDDKDRDEFVGMIRQELPHETYIEMAIQYYEWNMEDEALMMLDLAPENPMVQIWQAWLLDREGDKSGAEEKLRLAYDASPDLVFPFRPSMIGLFSWANQVMPGWKWPYYEALICWQQNQLSLARSLFLSCGMEPDFAPFYLTRAKLFSDNDSIVEESVEEAYKLDPASWRCAMEMARLQAREGKTGLAVRTACKEL